MGVRKFEIEWWGSISCAPFEIVIKNDVYVCWGKVNMVELELLDRKHRGWGAGQGHPPKRSRWRLVFANE